jgi:hemolysin D
MDNVRTAPPTPSAKATQRARRKDQEFLPAALEILEMPPSPVGMNLLLIICTLVVVALAWAYFGHVDVIATAEGKIQPTGKVKVVQSLETAKVQVINALNGSQVLAGQILLELDAAQPRAQVAAAEASLASYRAEITRRAAAIAWARSINLFDIAPMSHAPLEWSANIPMSISERESSVLDGDLASLHSELTSIAGQILQKEAEQRQIAATIVAEQELISTLQDRSSIRQNLLASQIGSKVDWLDTMEKVKTEQVTLATENAQLIDAQSSLEVLRRNLIKTRDAFIADNLQKLADAGRQTDDLTQKLLEAQAQLEHSTLRSPIDGTIQDSSVTTLGQVVTTGVELMRVVPTGSTLDVEAYLPNADVGFVQVGQTVNVKIEAFPFTRYGTVSARVSRVSQDAILEQDARQIESDPARSTGSGASITGQADSSHGLVFPISVALDRESIDADGRTVALSPGMAVTVEIKTGKRRILEYLFSPMVEVASQSMRER